MDDLEQMERHAYASGNTREAALLRAVIDLFESKAPRQDIIEKLEFELRKQL